MLTLAINTATTNTSVALLKNSKILVEKSWPARKNEAEKLLPAISIAFKKAKLSFSDLGGILSVAGPGAFTGLRVGVAIANGIAFSCNIPVFQCSTFDFLRHAVVNSKRERTVIMTKGGGPYFALMKSGQKKPLHVEADKLVDWLLKQKSIHYIFADIKNEEIKKLQKELSARKKKIVFLNLKKDLNFGKAFIEILNKKPPAHNMVKPLYLNKPQITQSKKDIYT